MDALSVQAAYDIWAETYDDSDNRTRDLDAAVLRRQPFQLDGAAVIEVGCGTGKNTEWLLNRGACVTAMDFSANMIAVARDRLPADRVRFIEHDVRFPWPVPERSAELITCNLVLEHIEDLRPVFAHARRALRPDGLFFVAEFHPFRQLLGKGARFTDASAEVVKVPAFLHDVSAYVSAGLGEGLELAELSEWRDEGVDMTGPPRLLALTFKRRS